MRDEVTRLKQTPGGGGGYFGEFRKVLGEREPRVSHQTRDNFLIEKTFDGIVRNADVTHMMISFSRRKASDGIV